MLKRTLVSFAALPLFFFAVYFSPDWVLPVVFAIIAAMAAYELLHNTGLTKNRALIAVAMILCGATVPLEYFLDLPLAAMVIPGALTIFAVALSSGGKITATEIFGAFFAVIFVPLAIGSLVRIRSVSIAVAILPFIAAWITDTSAYFVGVLFGRHKLAPSISPKKTIEGSIGGIIGCVGGMIASNSLSLAIWDVGFNLWLLAIFGVVGSIVAQTGDLALSYIKRAFGIKDFGSIMPGHGGVLDRFDSVLFAAPVIEILLLYIPVII
jgi:phosphatidate cytidylyltransferase